MERSTLFRSEALKHASEVEPLDEQVTLTSPHAWLILATLLLLSAAFMLWSFVGVVPTRISGQGLLLSSEGVYDVISYATGRVEELTVREGDLVERNQVIGFIAQPELDQDVQNAHEAALEALRERDLIRSMQADINAREDSLLDRQRANLEQNIVILEEKLEVLGERISEQQGLFEQGYIIEDVLQVLRQDYDNTALEIERRKNQLRQLEMLALERRYEREQQALNRTLALNEAHRQVRELENEKTLTSQILSPYAGRVVEIKSNVGSLIQKGMPILTIERLSDASTRLQAVLYVSPTDGKKIRPGMEVGLNPSSIRREEYGVLQGTVRAVADFPSTYEGIKRVLPNDQLVQALMQDGPPFSLYIDLVADPTTPSGYAWSSGPGPPVQVFSGTLCTAEITIQERRPIELIFPLLLMSFNLPVVNKLL